MSRIPRQRNGSGRRSARCARRESTSTGRSRTPIRLRPLCRRSTTSATTRSSSRPSRGEALELAPRRSRQAAREGDEAPGHARRDRAGAGRGAGVTWKPTPLLTTTRITRPSRTSRRASTRACSGSSSSSARRSCSSGRSSPRTSSSGSSTAIRGRPTATTFRSSSPASTRSSSSPRASRCTGRCSRSSAATAPD